MHAPKTIAVLFSCTESVVPPRCRKSRPVKFHNGEFVFEVPHAESHEAPVAIVSCGKIGYDDEARPFTVEYRWFAGRLWTAMKMDGVRPSGRARHSEDGTHRPLPDTIDARSDSATATLHDLAIHYGTYRTRLEAEEELRACMADHLAIDGQWFRPAGEPRYVVQTFGFGANHGGTALFATDHFNPNISRDCYYGLLDFEAAAAHATRTAEERGDTQSLPIRVNGGETFRVLLPEALQVQSRQKEEATGDEDKADAKEPDGASGIPAPHIEALLGLVREAAVPGGIGPHEFSRPGGWLERARGILNRIDGREADAGSSTP